MKWFSFVGMMLMGCLAQPVWAADPPADRPNDKKTTNEKKQTPEDLARKAVGGLLRRLSCLQSLTSQDPSHALQYGFQATPPSRIDFSGGCGAVSYPATGASPLAVAVAQNALLSLMPIAIALVEQTPLKPAVSDNVAKNLAEKVPLDPFKQAIQSYLSALGPASALDVWTENPTGPFALGVMNADKITVEYLKRAEGDGSKTGNEGADGGGGAGAGGEGAGALDALIGALGGGGDGGGSGLGVGSGGSQGGGGAAGGGSGGAAGGGGSSAGEAGAALGSSGFSSGTSADYPSSTSSANGAAASASTSGGSSAAPSPYGDLNQNDTTSTTAITGVGGGVVLPSTVDPTVNCVGSAQFCANSETNWQATQSNLGTYNQTSNKNPFHQNVSKGAGS